MDYDPIETIRNARYPFSFTIDIIVPIDAMSYWTLQRMWPWLSVAEPGTQPDGSSTTVRVGTFYEAPDAWFTLFANTTKRREPGTYALHPDDLQILASHVSMILADPDLAAPLVDEHGEATTPEWWDQLAALNAMFERLRLHAPQEYTLRYTILATPGMPDHLKEVIKKHDER